jgi:hypothetical protein
MGAAIPFCSTSEGDEGHFYALAWCSGLLPEAKTSVEGRLVLRFSPSEGFSRFSLSAHDEPGKLRMYHRGPTHSLSIEAALVDCWITFGVPPFVWHLFPNTTDGRFISPEHETEYRRARTELCRAVYWSRTRAWGIKIANPSPLFLPPPGGYALIDPFEENEENEELLNAMMSDPRP